MPHRQALDQHLRGQGEGGEHHPCPAQRRGVLDPATQLTGHFERQQGAVDVGGLMREIDDARAEDAARRLRMQTAAP